MVACANQTIVSIWLKIFNMESCVTQPRRESSIAQLVTAILLIKLTITDGFHVTSSKLHPCKTEAIFPTSQDELYNGKRNCIVALPNTVSQLSC